MTIRKHGSATGEVTEVEDAGMARQAARAAAGRTVSWDAEDERELAAENQAADGPRDDD